MLPPFVSPDVFNTSFAPESTANRCCPRHREDPVDQQKSQLVDVAFLGSEFDEGAEDDVMCRPPKEIGSFY